MPATMDLLSVAPPAMFDAADVTCVATDPHGSRVFTGDANGIVRCFVKEAESDGRTLPPPAGTAEAPPLLLRWTMRAAYDAVLVGAHRLVSADTSSAGGWRLVASG